jgi:hypothetical protein
LIAIHKLVDIHNALPESSEAKTAILRRIEQQVDQLDTQDTARRNPIGVALGVLILIVAGAASWLMASTGAWWWLATQGVAILWAPPVIEHLLEQPCQCRLLSRPSRRRLTKNIGKYRRCAPIMGTPPVSRSDNPKLPLMNAAPSISIGLEFRRTLRGFEPTDVDALVPASDRVRVSA